jgi:hypothetical protein
MWCEAPALPIGSWHLGTGVGAPVDLLASKMRRPLIGAAAVSPKLHRCPNNTIGSGDGDALIYFNFAEGYNLQIVSSVSKAHIR